MTESTENDDPFAAQKKSAAEAALNFVKSGMVLGLGTGSTTSFVLRGLADRLRDGRLFGIRGIPTSSTTQREALMLQIPLTDLHSDPVVDLTIDGADEVDPSFNLIKGGGGALLREKIVALASKRYIIVIDDSKVSDCIGGLHSVPVEVVEFGWSNHLHFLESLGAEVQLRRRSDDRPFLTDSGNVILDCRFGPITDSAALSAKLKARTGVVEHGLFLHMADQIIVAYKDTVRLLGRGINRTLQPSSTE